MLDSLGMWSAVRGLPDQLDAALAVAVPDGVAGTAPPSSVVLMGMGGSGIAADAAAAVVSSRCAVPLTVSKQYECPAHVGPDTLVVAVSFSGNTEETLAAAAAATEAGARVVTVAAGGELARIARELDRPLWPVDGSIPMPRAAIGAMLVATLRVLWSSGVVPDLSSEVAAASTQLRDRLATLAGDPAPVDRTASRIGRTLPLVYGGGALGEVAARRWKGQFNENPKVPSWANAVPELTHNEVCGWAQHGDVTRQVFTLLLLRHDHEHPQVSRRMELVREVCEEVVADVIDVHARGDGALAQLLDLVLVGDLVSLRMAEQAGVDPGPVPVLDDIKARLAGS